MIGVLMSVLKMEEKTKSEHGWQDLIVLGEKENRPAVC
jgi:hypothetical protein